MKLDHYDVRAIMAAKDLNRVAIANQMRSICGSNIRFAAVTKGLLNLPVKIS
jgi:hypothetical protein